MKNRKLIDRLQEGIVIGDGAMGTMLYQHGAFLNTCFDEICLTGADLIETIHTEYVNTGCDFIETNSFGANEFKLGRFGLADAVEQINETAAQIARKAANDKVMVAGAIGPTGTINPNPNDELKLSLTNAFSTQANALAKGGVDFLLLETFTSASELLIAIDASAKTDLPIVAQMTCTEQLETLFGTPIDKAIGELANHDSVIAVGINCTLGPSDMLEGLKRLRKVTDKPISIHPNAGLPRRVEGRTLYMCTPEYMAEYAKRFYENGGSIIGGCCGTTPAHIREIVKSVRPLARSMEVKPTFVSIDSKKQKPTGMEPLKLNAKSSFGEKLAAGKLVTCIELTPPRGVDTDRVIESAKLCADHGIDAINIPDGPRASARLSPLVTALKVEASANIETILHICCRDKNLIGLQSDLLGIHAMGLGNVLLITGDPPKLGEYPDATGVFDLDSVALTQLTAGLNRGLDIAGNELPQQLSLTVGVGANPVASELQREIDRFKLKVAAGAEYAITQPVFDIEMFYQFKDAVSDCKLPLIAGIWPFTSYKNAEFMANEVPGVVVPDVLLERMSRASTRDEGRRIGIEIAREMIESLTDHVAGFAVSAPFGNVKIALAALGRYDFNEL